MSRRLLAAVVLVLSGCSSDPPKPDPHLVSNEAKQRGFQAMGRGDFTAAETEFQTAAAQVPHDPFTELNLGVAEQHLGKLDAARAAYRDAIADGKKATPVEVTDPMYGGHSIAQLAQADLDGMDMPLKPAAGAKP